MPYKKYLNDANIDVPRTTRWRKRRADEDGGRNVRMRRHTDPAEQDATEINRNDPEPHRGQPDHTDHIAAAGQNEHADAESEDEDGTAESENEHRQPEENQHAEHAEPAYEYGADESGNECGQPEQNESPELHQEEMFGQPFNPDKEIYAGSNMTSGALLLLLIAFILRHTLSTAAVKDLLILLNHVVPQCVPTTRWFLDKLFFDLNDKAQMHFYCPACQSYLGCDPDNHCETCHTRVDKKSLMELANYFLVMPLKSQISSIVVSLQSKIKTHFQRDGTVHDIPTGRLYNEGCAFTESTDNITLSINCDGAPVFKSSHYSIWPILCTINELPFVERCKNLILHSLWFGREKPKVNTFFTPFISEINKLDSTGFQWEDQHGVMHRTRVRAKIFVCDAPARAMLQHLKQFNGEYGCGHCYHPGQMIPKGRGFTRAYPLQGYVPQLRDKDSTIELAESVHRSNNGQAQLGVKGASPLILLPSFDIIKGFVPDYMHSVCLGVVRQFVNLWFDSQYSQAAFHLPAAKLLDIDSNLSKIYPPNEVRRTPRPLSDRKFWKASEWRAFLLLFSPVILRNILARQFYNHWMLLACALHILLANTATHDQLNLAEVCLAQFVAQVPELYGIEHCSYNCHLLTHLTQSVKDWGLLWANSAFVYEDTNGKLLRLYSGTQSVPAQIFKYFFAFQKLVRTGHDALKNASEDVRRFYKSMTCNDIVTKSGTHIFDHVVAFGTGSHRQLTARERLALQNNVCLNGYAQHTTNVTVYNRCVVEKMLLTTIDYSAGFKRCNAAIATKSHYGVINALVVLPKNCDCDQPCSCKELLIFYKSLLKESNQLTVYNVDRTNVASFVVNVRRTEELSVTTFKEVTKCILMECGDQLSVVKMPRFELD